MSKQALLTYIQLLEQTALSEEQSAIVEGIKLAVDGIVVATEGAQTTPVASTSRVRTPHILVVEDDPVHQLFATNALSKAGYTVTIAPDGLEAIKLFKTKKFDLIIMDGQLPKLDGCETVEKMREAEKGRNTYTPIIALTAHAIAGYPQRCIQVGMDEHLTKPISRTELLSRIEFWLSQRR